jgi:ABC-type antimicrobial peptide transport system permease subunit
VVRFTGDEAALAASIRRAIAAADPTIPLESVRTLARVRQDETWASTFLAWTFALLASVALLLAAVGLYGVLAYAASQRMSEIGIRMALGAGAADVIRMIVGEGLRLCVGGAMVGLGGTLLMAPLLRRALYQVGPTDPLTLASAIGFLLTIGLGASYLPARMASRVDPLRLLRRS